MKHNEIAKALNKLTKADLINMLMHIDTIIRTEPTKDESRDHLESKLGAICSVLLRDNESVERFFRHARN